MYTALASSQFEKECYLRKARRKTKVAKQGTESNAGYKARQIMWEEVQRRKPIAMNNEKGQGKGQGKACAKNKHFSKKSTGTKSGYKTRNEFRRQKSAKTGDASELHESVRLPCKK